MEFKVFSNINHIKNDWISIERIGSLGIYQSYEFNRIYYYGRAYSSISLKNPRVIKNRKCVFVVGYDNGQAVCIAPLIVNNYPNRTVYLLGHGTNAGTLDYIYYDQKFVIPTFDFCKKLFDGYDFEFIFVNENSPLVEVMNVTEVFENYVVSMNSFQEHYLTLSKHSKQNLRTSYNRLIKDDCKFDIQISSCGTKQIYKLLKKNMVVYDKRRKEWVGDENIKSMGISNKRSLFSNLRYYIRTKRDIVLSGMLNMSCAEMATLYINDKIAAFFVGFWERGTSSIHIPRLAINSDFYRYSPGIIMISEYLKSQTKSINFNLGRGSEKYKSDLGGKLYKSFRLKFPKD